MNSKILELLKDKAIINNFETKIKYNLILIINKMAKIVTKTKTNLPQ